MKAAQGLAIRGLIPLGPLQAARSEHTPLAVRAITVRACASDSPFREPKTPKEEQDVEKVVKAGVNVPDSTGQAAREAKDAAVGLAESISMSAKAMATAAKRAMGLAVHEKPFSNDEIHGAAGKMEHAPPGSTTGGASVDQQHAEAKYGEISLTEKPPFTRGEGSVNEMFPNMSEAAHLQSNTAEDQATANARLSKDMRAQGGSKDEELESNLHNKGP